MANGPVGKKNLTIAFRDENTYRKSRITNARIFSQLTQLKATAQIDVVFNCGGYVNGVYAMVNTPEKIMAYNDLPDQEIFQELLKKGIVMAIYDDGKLPAYIQPQKQVILLKDELMRTGF